MPVISVAGTRVLLAMSPPGVCLRRHGDTGRDPDVTPRRDSAGGSLVPPEHATRCPRQGGCAWRTSPEQRPRGSCRPCGTGAACWTGKLIKVDFVSARMGAGVEPAYA